MTESTRVTEALLLAAGMGTRLHPLTLDSPKILTRVGGISILERLVPRLGAGGIILCRESTVRGENVKREGDYAVIYRSVAEYERIFNRCGLVLHSVERNEPYVLLQMGCEWIKKWKNFMSERFQGLRILGRLTYWALRLGNPWINQLPKALGIEFPRLENHFFVLGVTPISTE